VTDPRSSLLRRIKGGHRSHIEICTVDCSVYLLYPPPEDLQLWYEELKLASARVESVEKKKSGSVELALCRRLRALPRQFSVRVQVHQLIVQSEEEPGRSRRGSEEAVFDAASASATAAADAPAPAPAPAPASSAPAAPSLMRRMADSARNATLTAAKIRVTPVGRGTLRATEEERWVSEVPLISGGSSGASERMFASWQGAGGALPTFEAPAATSASAPAGAGTALGGGKAVALVSSVELGQSCCVSPDEIESVLLTAKVNSVINGYGELGRVSVDLASLLSEDGSPREDMHQLKLRRKRSGRVVGSVLVTIKTWKI